MTDDRTRRPEIGVLLPTREMAMTGDYSTKPLLAFARQAEEYGFDSLWTGDSLLARPRLDPLIVLAAMAATTSSLTLGTAALTAALRPPLVGANMIAALDRICDGRLELGLGAGFPIPETEEEFAAAGVPFAGRAARLDDTVALWRQAWRSRDEPGAADFDGRLGQWKALDRLPPPARPGGPRLWLAGSDTPAVTARVARHYDGWLPFLPSAEAYAAAWHRIEDLAAEHGRRPDAITPGLYATVNINPDRSRARRELDTYVQGYYGRPLAAMETIQAYGYGSAEECARWLAGYLEAGARHIVLRIGSLHPGPQLKKIAQELLPALRPLVKETK